MPATASATGAELFGVNVHLETLIALLCKSQNEVPFTHLMLIFVTCFIAIKFKGPVYNVLDDLFKCNIMYMTMSSMVCKDLT